MPSNKPSIRFSDIVEQIGNIESFVEGMDKASLHNNVMARFAVERAISIISEAAVKLGDQASVYAPDIAWHDIRGIGNVIRHAYDMVSIDLIWDIIEIDLPPLKVACQKALLQLNSNAPKPDKNGDPDPIP